MRQSIKHQRTLLVLAAIFLICVVLGGSGFYVYIKRKHTVIPVAPAPAPTLEKPVVQDDTHEGIHLTRREKEIASLCCEGLQDKEIAARLNISERTVGTHKLNIFKKCGVNNTVELVRLYYKMED